MARRAVELGFGNSLGIIHDGTGQLKPLSGKEARIYEELKRFGKKSWTRLNRFQDDLAYGRPLIGGAAPARRYLYICEDGLVHYCSQQRGYPAVPLENYPRGHQASFTPKSPAPRCVPSPAFNRSL